MEIKILKQQIVELLLKANPDIHIVDEDEDLFSERCGVKPRDLVYVCMEIKKRYHLDYNQVVKHVKVYTINGFAGEVMKQVNLGKK